VEIVSTNTGHPVTITWENEDRITGIYKTPQPQGIFLGPDGVVGDTIGNPKTHGGALKAAYLFSEDAYSYWKPRYPALNWELGMFGENLTVRGLDETQLYIGSVYRIGEAVVRITTPREPCYKLGLRFEDQSIIDAFIKHGRPGTYVCVVEAGFVRTGDKMEVLEVFEDSLSISEFYNLLYSLEKDKALVQNALKLPWISSEKQKQFQKWLS
jgi:MOSC domain-containing protein YiiM